MLDGTIMRVIDGERAEAKIGPKGEYAIRLEPKYAKDGRSKPFKPRIEFRQTGVDLPQTTNAETKDETQAMQMY